MNINSSSFLLVFNSTFIFIDTIINIAFVVGYFPPLLKLQINIMIKRRYNNNNNNNVNIVER